MSPVDAPRERLAVLLVPRFLIGQVESPAAVNHEAKGGAGNVRYGSKADIQHIQEAVASGSGSMQN
jgi:hypothetical protein